MTFVASANGLPVQFDAMRSSISDGHCGLLLAGVRIDGPPARASSATSSATAKAVDRPSIK